MIHCEECKITLEPKYTYCPYCGRKLARTNDIFNNSDMQIEDGVLIKYNRPDSNSRDRLKIIVPSGVTTIGKNAFTDQDYIDEIVLPDTVTVIDDFAFAGCGANHISLPDNLNYIGRAAFKSNTYLQQIKIPSSITEIPEKAFSGCKFLKDVIFPNSLQKIGIGAFRGCEGLGKISLPDSCTEIGEGAFAECTHLYDVDLNNVDIISINAFRDCTSLTDITFYGSHIGRYAFSGCGELYGLNIKVTSSCIIDPKAFGDRDDSRDVTIEKMW